MERQYERLEREVSETRARLSDTLDELRARMAPGPVFDQFADFLRRNPAADALNNLVREIRDNPLPLSLIVVGVAWLIIAGSLRSRPRSAHSARLGNSLVDKKLDLLLPPPAAKKPRGTVMDIPPRLDKLVGQEAVLQP